MRELDITELGNPDTIIKQEILKTSSQRTDIIRPTLEELFNTSSIHIAVQDIDSIPFNLYMIDVSLKDKGRIRYRISEQHLDTLLCLHLNISKDVVKNQSITESHHAFFTKLCTRTLKYLNEDLTDYKLVEGGRSDFNINLKYELTINIDTVDIFISIDNVLSQNLSSCHINNHINKNANNQINNINLSNDELKLFIERIPTKLDVILMRRITNINNLHNLKKGDFISLNNLEPVELKINNEAITTAKLVVAETSQIGVCYE